MSVYPAAKCVCLCQVVNCLWACASMSGYRVGVFVSGCYMCMCLKCRVCIYVILELGMCFFLYQVEILYIISFYISD